MWNTLPRSIKEHPYAYIYKDAWRDMHDKNKMFGCVITGQVGTGKTYAALKMAYDLDRNSKDKPRFKLENVVFSAIELAEILQKRLLKGTAIVLDDAGLMAYSKDAMSKEVKEISKIFMSVRHRNLCIILTLPVFKMLAANVRQTLNSLIVMAPRIDYTNKRSLAKFYYLSTNHINGDIYTITPTYYEKSVHPKTGIVFYSKFKNPFISFKLPPSDLIGEYEVIRKEKMIDFYKKSKVILSAKEAKRKRKSYAEWEKEIEPKFENFLGPDGMLSQAKLLRYGVPTTYATVMVRSFKKLHKKE